MKPASRILAAALVAVVLTGCSSGGSKADKKDDSSSTSTIAAGKNGSKTGATNPPASVPVTGEIDRGEPPSGTGIIKTTKMASCDTKPGAVTAKGTVELPAGMDPATVVISVSWVNSATATVFTRKRLSVENVEAGKSTDWEISSLLPDNKVPVRCVLGAVALD